MADLSNPLRGVNLRTFFLERVIFGIVSPLAAHLALALARAEPACLCDGGEHGFYGLGAVEATLGLAWLVVAFQACDVLFFAGERRYRVRRFLALEKRRSIPFVSLLGIACGLYVVWTTNGYIEASLRRDQSVSGWITIGGLLAGPALLLGLRRIRQWRYVRATGMVCPRPWLGPAAALGVFLLSALFVYAGSEGRSGTKLVWCAPRCITPASNADEVAKSVHAALTGISRRLEYGLFGPSLVGATSAIADDRLLSTLVQALAKEPEQARRFVHLEESGEVSSLTRLRDELLKTKNEVFAVRPGSLLVEGDAPSRAAGDEDLLPVEGSPSPDEIVAWYDWLAVKAKPVVVAALTGKEVLADSARNALDPEAYTPQDCPEVTASGKRSYGDQLLLALGHTLACSAANWLQPTEVLDRWSAQFLPRSAKSGVAVGFPGFRRGRSQLLALAPVDPDDAVDPRAASSPGDSWYRYPSDLRLLSPPEPGGPTPGTKTTGPKKARGILEGTFPRGGMVAVYSVGNLALGPAAEERPRLNLKRRAVLFREDFRVGASPAVRPEAVRQMLVVFKPPRKFRAFPAGKTAEFLEKKMRDCLDGKMRNGKKRHPKATTDKLGQGASIRSATQFFKDLNCYRTQWSRHQSGSIQPRSPEMLLDLDLVQAPVSDTGEVGEIHPARSLGKPIVDLREVVRTCLDFTTPSDRTVDSTGLLRGEALLAAAGCEIVEGRNDKRGDGRLPKHEIGTSRSVLAVEFSIGGMERDCSDSAHERRLSPELHWIPGRQGWCRGYAWVTIKDGG